MHVLQRSITSYVITGTLQMTRPRRLYTGSTAVLEAELDLEVLPEAGETFPGEMNLFRQVGDITKMALKNAKEVERLYSSLET